MQFSYFLGYIKIVKFLFGLDRQKDKIDKVSLQRGLKTFFLLETRK